MRKLILHSQNSTRVECHSSISHFLLRCTISILSHLRPFANLAGLTIVSWRWLLCWVLLLPLTAVASTAYVVVDTSRKTVSVLDAGRTLLQLKGAALGRGGVAKVHVQGDGRTPLGEFHIAWINHQSPYHLFFGLNYPTATQALAGYDQGIINKQSLEQIRQAIAAGHLPPQNTQLGGHIGIHGLGKGSRWMHQHFNWTEGCVALTNKQIEKLAQWLEIGTRVVIQ